MKFWLNYPKNSIEKLSNITVVLLFNNKKTTLNLRYLKYARKKSECEVKIYRKKEKKWKIIIRFLYCHIRRKFN